MKEGPEYWRNLAKEDINKYLRHQPNTRKARNIVLMVGDGMGLSTTTAARILKGQLQNKTGEESKLNFEEFPYTGFSKVYTTNYQVPDSAATMTAMVSGVKTKSWMLGVDSSAIYDVCHDLTDHKLPSILHWTQAAGKSTGFVTTARVTHATPAALYAATTNRYWENDHNLPVNSEGLCLDIASQLVYNASEIQVILGGGAQNFIPYTIPDPTTGFIDFIRQRFDGRNLIQAWKNDKEQKNVTHKIVHNKGQLNNVDPKSTDFLFVWIFASVAPFMLRSRDPRKTKQNAGDPQEAFNERLFANSHMSYELERDKSEAGQPSLAEMTRKAIQILERNENGFFLMVEGARIDHGHHSVTAKDALIETLMFEEAVQTVLDMTNETETLVIVTADHSHTMTISGYPQRGNSILDLVKDDSGELSLAEDDLPYTTLMYANGPHNVHPRRNLTDVDTGRTGFTHNTVVDIRSETHSGEDVAVYAQGPMAHLLTGVKEQNVIAYVMAHAACVGKIGIPCEAGRESSCDEISSCDIKNIRSASLCLSVNLVVICSTLCYHMYFIVY